MGRGDKVIVSGRVIDQDGRGVPGVTIFGAGTKTNASGSYSGKVCKGGHVRIFPVGEEVLAVTACSNGNVRGKTCELDVEHGGGIASFRVERALVISGLVFGADGKRLANVVVVATSGGRTYRGRTDSLGLVRLRVRGAGQYVVRTVGLVHSTVAGCLPGHPEGRACVLDLNRTGPGVVTFRVIDPGIEGLYEGASASCTVIETERRGFPQIEPGRCDHPALLGGRIEVRGRGFEPDQTIRLKWFLADEFAPERAISDNSFADFEVKANAQGNFAKGIQANYLLEGTCETKMVAEQGKDRATDTIGFRPQIMLLRASGHFRIRGHPAAQVFKHGPFLCDTASRIVWGEQIKDGVGRGDLAIVQSIPRRFTVGEPDDGVSVTSGGGFWILSIAPDGQRISCEDCELGARELQVQAPDGTFTTIKSEDTVSGNVNIWGFALGPATQPFEFGRCPPGPRTSVFASHQNVAGCELYGNGARFNGGLFIESRGSVLANGLIQVRRGLAMGDSATLVAATDRLIIKGGISASNVYLIADESIELAQ